jgi:hypothetical protein
MLLMPERPRETCIGWNLHNSPAQFLHSENLWSYAQLNQKFPKSFSLTQDAIAAPFAIRTIFQDMDVPPKKADYRIYTHGSSILMANGYLQTKQNNFSDFVADHLRVYSRCGRRRPARICLYRTFL